MPNSHDPSQVAEDAVAAADPIAVPSLAGVLDGMAATVFRGASLGKVGVGLGSELARIAVGRSEVAPAKGDWRFKDPTWSNNPVYKRIAQTYLAACDAVDRLLDDLEASGDQRRAERARFVMGVLTSAAAPTNTLLGNPAALKKTLEVGGGNLLRGARNFASDLRRNGGMPSMAKPGALKVGEDLAVTPGKVIDKDEHAELLHYAPSTDTVRARPVLVVPPPIGRYYFLDLRPGRSFAEYAVSRGLQTFMVSWRNPTAEHAGWDIDTYARRIVSAIDVVRETTGSADVNIIGFCAGGMLNATVLNHLAATRDDRVHSASFAVTMLDFGQPAPIAAFSAPRLLSIARWNSGRSGVITARAMGNVFTWMRPNDLVWNYWVNNYLLGEDPPVFDILSWNADGTNLPAALHRQFLDIFENNVLIKPAAMQILGTPVDLGTIKVPTYVTGAVNDHLTPWKATYRTTQLLAGDSTFALSNAGHIASLVNPPGNPKATYFTGPLDPAKSPDEWLAHAVKQTGSWWEHWADWVLERSGGAKPAPVTLGSERFPPQESAPGTYVLQKA
ncbi:MAG TPA: alpha/beta fold hydrolase [Pseudonocardiaceae bacterium]